MLCDRCIHNEVCGEEGHLDEALTFCACREERSTGEWIPVKFHPCTDEEFEHMKELFGEDIDRDNFPIFDCPMPKDEQEVLISSHWGVEKDIAHYENGEYWLDCRDNWEGVEAWMPSPEQYKGGETDDT